MAGAADTNKCLRSLGWILAAAVILLVYAPYVIWGGIIIDDWAVVYHVADSPRPPSLWESYRGWFPLFSNRPLAPIALALTSHLFAGCPRGFILLNLGAWIGAVALFIAAVRPYHGPAFGYLFLLLAAFPPISSTVIFSPAMQMLGSISVFLWALSFWLLLRGVVRDRYSCGPYLLLLAALLTYEVILPLLSLTLLYPLALGPCKSTGRRGRCFSTWLVKYVLPVVLILLAVLILQKWIMPHFMPVDSRLRLPSLRTGCFLCITWFGSVLILTPWLFLRAPYYLPASHPACWQMVLVAMLLVAGFFAWRPARDWSSASCFDRKYRLLGIMLLGFLSCPLLYVLSSSPPLVGGYGNRGLTSAWLMLSMLLACLPSLPARRTVQALSLATVLLVLALSVASFMVQRDNYILSWRLQNQVVEAFVAKAKEAGLPPGARIIGNVPRRVQSNYNDEEVFGNYWDFGRALRLATGGLVADGIPVTRTQIDQGKVKQQGGELLVNGLWRTDTSALWFFEFDQVTHRCRLLKIRDSAHLSRLLGEIGRSEVNHVPDSMATRLPAQWKEFFRRCGL
jgi:hypothetical protein